MEFYQGQAKACTPLFVQSRDYMMRQIDQLGLVLRVLVEKLLGREQHEPIQSAFDQADLALRTQADISLTEILAMTDEGFVQWLLQKHSTHVESFSYWADLLYEFGYQMYAESPEDPKVMPLFQKCETLHRWLDLNSNTFSMTRAARSQQMRDIIDQIKTLPN